MPEGRASRSLWIETSPGRAFPRLERDVVVDVAIVGGGITGLTAALLLKRAGKSVAVLDAFEIAEGATGHTTAHLTEVLDTRYHVLASRFGEEGASLAFRSHRAAIERIARFVSEEKIACDFHRLPAFLYAEDDAGAGEIEKELAAAKRLGLPVSKALEVPLPFPVKRALRFEDQGRFHPRKYLAPLARQVPGGGSHIFAGTRAVGIEDGEPCVVATERGPSVTARDVIVAANAPVGNRFVLHTKVAHYRSYVVVLDAAGGAPREPRPGDALFDDMADPYHYVRWHDRFLLVGGEDHKTGKRVDTHERYARLASYARARFGDLPVAFRWSAQVVEPADGLAYIGRNPRAKRVYVATGFSGNGMTYGTLAAILLSDLIAGRENPWAALYDPSRKKPIASAKAFVSENIDFPLRWIGDRLRPAQARSLDELAPGEGKIVSLDGEKVAAYRDERGAVTALSPICTHLACHVQFNAAEKTWDCPCHGSRFDVEGNVIHGPAIRPLERKRIETPRKDDAHAQKGRASEPNP